MVDIVKKIQFLNSVINKDYGNIVAHTQYVHTLKDELIGLVNKCNIAALLLQIDNVTLNMFKNIINKSSELLMLTVTQQVQFLFSQINKEDDSKEHTEYLNILLDSLEEVIHYRNDGYSEIDHETQYMLKYLLKKFRERPFYSIKKQIKELNNKFDESAYMQLLESFDNYSTKKEILIQIDDVTLNMFQITDLLAPKTLE